MAVHTYLIDVEYNPEFSGYHPISVVCWRGQKREGQEVGEAHGKTVKGCLTKIVSSILKEESEG